jgi:MFS family permease
VAFYASVFPFIQYAPDLLVNKFGFSYALPEGASITLFGSESAGSAGVFVIIFLFALGFTLIPDFFKGKKTKLMVVSAIVLVFAFLVYQVWDILAIWLENGPKAASLIPLGSIVFTPIFGKYVDTNGKAASIMIIGSLLLIFANLSLSLFSSPVLAYMGLVSLGIAFSLVPAAMWPAVAKIVPDNRLGTAYASMFTLQNWGLGAFFWGIGWLLSKMNTVVESTIAATRETLSAEGLTGGEISARITELQVAGEIPFYDYTWPILLLVGCGFVSIWLAYLLKKEDKKNGYGLELPSNE